MKDNKYILLCEGKYTCVTVQYFEPFLIDSSTFYEIFIWGHAVA
jgi:hypothetical protein